MGSLEEAVNESVRTAIEPVLQELEELRKLISSPPPPRLAVSVAEAATMFGVSERTIRNWISTREIKGNRVGGRMLIPVDQFDGLLSGV